MKYTSIIVALLCTVPTAVFAATPPITTRSGGTGVSDVAAGSILFGSTYNIRMATSSVFQWNNAASRLSFTYGSSTALSATTLCLIGDTCRTTWPIGLTFGKTWELGADAYGVSALSPTSSVPIYIGGSTATSSFRGGIESWKTIGAPYFFATSTATSTFVGGINISGTDCVAIAGTCLQTYIQNATAYKTAANYATAAVLPGTPSYSNGSSGVGATLTEVGFGALVVDGQTVTLGQRILVKNQADQTQNGVYTVTTVGSGIASYLLTRATDFNTSNDVYAGVTVPVLAGGTANGDTVWTESTTGTITIGSSNIAFIESSVGSAADTFAYPFSSLSIYGVTAAATTSSLQTSGTIFASSTSATSTFDGGILLANKAGNVGIGTSTPFGALSINGKLQEYGSYSHFGTVSCGSASGELAGANNVGLELCGSVNSDLGGVQLQIINTNSGASAWSGITLANDRGDATQTHFGGMFFNASGYTSTAYGGVVGIPQEMQIQDTDGPLVLIASTSTGQAYISFLTGGTASTSERMRIASNGRVGIGTTTPLGLFNIFAKDQDTNRNLFVIGSSTVSATSTLFSIDNTGGIFTQLSSSGVGVNASGKLYNAATTTFSTGLTWLDNAVTCNTASGSVLGCLSSANWTTFNAKQAPGFQISTTSGITAPSVAYWTDVGKTLSGAATSSLTASGVLTLSNPVSVIGASASALTVTGGANGQALAWASGAPTWVATTTFSAGSGISLAQAGNTWTISNTGAYAFTPATTQGQNTSATTTALWAQATPFSLFASSTAMFQNASTTALATVGSTLWLTNYTSSGLAVDANHKVYAAATTTFSGGLTYLNGAATCDTASVSLLGCVSVASFNLFTDKVGTTSNSETKGQLAAWGSTSATPPLLYSIATSSFAASAGFSYSGTLGAAVGGTGGTLSLIEHHSFTISTTTAWTGTTTKQLEVGYGEVWNTIQCFTDIGTLNVQVGYGSASTTIFNASTTIGTVQMTPNNTMTAGNKVKVDIGTPATSPTKVTCTVKDTN